jgi:NAD(P)H-nitrite reductase large subunit
VPNKRYVIVGNGAAGISAAESIRSVDRRVGVTIISDEPHAAYSKVLLHYYVDSRIEENKLFIRNKDFYKDLSIDTIFGKAVESISTAEQAVYLTDNSKIPFDKLLIATGSSPKTPAIKSNVENGIHTMWTL